MSGKRLLVVGDMVSGMADVTTPYVGQIVDLAAGGPPQTSAMESASAPSSGGGCVMTINGLPVAHAGCIATANPPLPQAKPLMFCAGLTLNGMPLLVELGQFMASPSGSLASSAVTQQSVRVNKAVTGPEGAAASAEQAAKSPGGGPPVRSNYGTPTTEHVIASRVSSPRLADLLPPEYAHLVGDPVDVATGAVVTRQVDDHSPKYDLAFERHYTSRHADRESVLGWGWSHVFEQSVWLEVGRVVLSDAGRQIEFDTFDLMDQVARAGDVLRDATGRLALTCHGRNAWELFDGESTRYFLPMPGTSAADKDRGLSRLSTLARPGLPLVELHYDDKARLTSVRTDGTAVFTLRYDRDGLLESLNDRVMRYDYSAAGDLIEARDLEGHARQYEYRSHLLVRETNRRGGAFFYGYDGHEPSSRCVRTWGEGGRLHRMIAYESGTTLVTDSLGERTTYRISPIGLVLARTDPQGRALEYGYDDQLRLVSVRHPDKNRALDHYNADGRRVKHRERDGAVWQMEYDHAGRLVLGFDPAGGRWEFGYDLDGHLTRVQDPDHHVHRMEYAQGRLSKVIDPLGRVVEFALGVADEVLELRAPWQPDMQFEYDASGRLTGAVSQSGDEARWYYDGSGQLVGAMRGGGLVQWRRDPEGSVTQQQTEATVETLVRDAFGRLLRRHGDGLDVGYHYDTEDRLLSASREGGARIDFERDASGQVSRFAVDGGVPTAVERDPDSGAITTLAFEGHSVQLKWDQGGRLVACEDRDGKRSYTYREDGLLMSYATQTHACTLQRNALGVVTEQVFGDQKISSPDVDHRGNRYGVEVSDGASLFYLWSSTGVLERIGLVGDMPFEVDFEIAPDASRGVATTGDGRAEYPNLLTDAPAPFIAGGEVRDGLLRPLQDADGNALLWDEGRLLVEGDAVHVYALPANHRLGTVRGEAFVLDDTDASQVEAEGLDAAVAACCLGPDRPLVSAADLTPEAFLRHTFARRVWNEQPRPIAGTQPWSPDTWAPADVEPSTGPTRLDQHALMRWLSPFPVAKLRVLSDA